MDLTRDQRFTLSDVTIGLLDSIEDPLTITVYFSGDIPTKYKRIEEEIKIYLYELTQHADGKLFYEFVDPTGDNGIYKEFEQGGHQPFPIIEGVGTAEQKVIYALPYMVLSYGNQRKVVNLIKGAVIAVADAQGRVIREISTEKTLANFEYNFTSALYNLTRSRRPVVGFLGGHGEYKGAAIADFTNELMEFYDTVWVDVTRGNPISPGVELILCMKPDSSFRDRELYEIDQYLMRGGRMIWVYDNEIVDFDMGAQRNTMTILRDLRLDYMFFKWGIKVRRDMLMHYYCDPITAVVDQGGRSQPVELPWHFFATIDRFPDHPVTRNLDRVMLRFSGTIDTLAAIPGIEREVIMRSSEMAFTLDNIRTIEVDRFLKDPPPKSLFDKGPFVTGIVLRGKLPSSFATRIRSEAEAPVDSLAPLAPTPKFLPHNIDTLVPKIAVISDAEFVASRKFRGKYHLVPYDNKAFMLNLVDYMSGNDVISKVRAKDITVSQLDADVIEESKFMIQFVNLAVPILLILMFGFGRGYLRRRRNAGLKKDKL